MSNQTLLSVNINKVALIRNSRGGNRPNLVQVAQDLEAYGAQGITIHPRPDERHARYSDASQLKRVVQTELNIEGYPTERFLQMVHDVRPHQCTLVPDEPGQLTSDHGWDVVKHQRFLREVIEPLRANGIRVSIFLDPDPGLLGAAADTGADRIELYTGPYAHAYHTDPEAAIKSYRDTALACEAMSLGVNAGHDLDLDNLRFFHQQIPGLLEVSIGHAFVSDSLYYGLSNTVGMYKSCLRPTVD